MLVSVPATIITSDWRGEARGASAEALHVVARHRRLHHLDRAAREAERHPHQRAGARPGDQVVGGGDEKALVGQLVREAREERIVRLDERPAFGRRRGQPIQQLTLARPSLPLQRAAAPFIDEADRQHAEERHHRPEGERSLPCATWNTHGNRNATSRSKMMKRIETR